MRILALVLFPLVTLSCPSLAQPADPDVTKIVNDALKAQGKLGPNQRAVVTHRTETATSTGAGGSSQGDKAQLDIKGEPQQVGLTGTGFASGGGFKAEGTAETITRSNAFIWAAAIVGVLGIAAGVLLFRQKNVRGALIVGGSGLLLLLGAILFPAWLAIILLLFFVAVVAEYALTHKSMFGSMSSMSSGIQDSGDMGKAVMANIQKHITPDEAPIITRVAVANEAPNAKA